MTMLAGKSAIITGASAGIGREAALLFAQEGARLVLTARRRAELEQLAAQIAAAGGTAVALPGDIRDDAHAAALVAAAEARHGGLDIAFNNAGVVGRTAPAADLEPADWQEVLEVNLTAAFLAARHQAPALQRRGGGSLIFTGSFVGHTAGLPGMAAYAAAKAGLVGLVQCLAAELGPAGVRVNALLPGGTDTAMNVARAPGAGPEVLAFVQNLHALKRLAEPQEIARAALFLASDLASFVTGSAMLADGGASICRG
ncbi:SDR family oxidoreductase [Marinibaculum pumilum]|uniref:SDR family oxidoreductase n=1 Tax=Marinibaculum pumilum TaxID=1766165 RepID=A0ABV7L057_9PROT